MNNSIGTLAALAFIAIPAVPSLARSSVTEAASFSNVVASFTDGLSFDFDIDGDNTRDFSVFGNAGFSLNVRTFDTTTLRSEPLIPGNTFLPTDATTNSTYTIFQNEVVYLGFDFITGGQNHAAWVLFDATGPDPVVVGGGWQTTSGLGVVVGNPSPIPEPASFAALAGSALLAGAALRRRRSTTPAQFRV